MVVWGYLDGKCGAGMGMIIGKGIVISQNDDVVVKFFRNTLGSNGGNSQPYSLSLVQ